MPFADLNKVADTVQDIEDEDWTPSEKQQLIITLTHMLLDDIKEARRQERERHEP